MKKFLLIMVIACTGMYNLVRSQCTVNNLAVQLRSVNSINNECQVIFDLSWNQEVNNGNKYACIHLWRSDQYPYLNVNGLAYTNTSDQPTSSDLVNAIATIVIEHNGTSNPVIGMAYDPDPTVSVISSGLDVKKEPINSTWERMTVRNISLTIPTCTGSGITGDIWASQADHGQNVHCVSSSVSFIVGNPRVTGLLFCAAPRHYSVQIGNVGNADISVTYNMYIDEGDGIYEPTSHDLKITSTPVGPIALTPGNIYNSGIQSYLPYSNEKPYSDHGLWVEVTTAGIPNVTVAFVDNTCTPLPVNFSSFTAIRDHSIVQLNWETSTEINNRGFELQRKTGSENFQAIAFVPSKAPMGNSQYRVTYNYNDINPITTISEYRIKQIDIDDQSKYSETRVVWGEGQKKETIIFPNPVSNDNIKIIFEDVNTKHDILMLDATGRLVKKWGNFIGQNLFIDNIAPGIYILQIINNETKERRLERIAVLK